MAIFQGSLTEIHKFVGPRIRNVVNQLAKKYRDSKNGICEECVQKAELQSAHVHGKERKTIIKCIANKYKQDNERYYIDLEKFEREIREAHMPIEEVFRFLCQTCHKEYDNIGNGKNMENTTQDSLRVEDGEEFKKLGKIKRWAKKPEQKNHRIIQSYRKIEKNNQCDIKELEKECTKKDSLYFIGDDKIFKRNLNSMKTDKGNSHGKIFYQKDSLVIMYKNVKREVEACFPSLKEER